MRHCCLLGFDCNGVDLSGPLGDLRSRLCKQDDMTCLFLGSAADFDSLVIQIEHISGSLEGVEHLEFFLITKGKSSDIFCA
jgi:hypothetical protein